MDLAILQEIARELNETLPGGFIHKIHQPLPREIVLRIRSRFSGELRLVMSADPAMGRLHLTTQRIPNPPRPPRFCEYLRAHLQGARVQAIKAEEHDRVVRVMASRGHSEQRKEMELILELLGRDSNIILLDRGSNMIMDCLHHLPRKEKSTRIVVPGTLYEMPPPRQTPGSEQGKYPCSVIRPGITRAADGKCRLTVAAVGFLDEVFPSMNTAADAFYSPKLSTLLLEAFRRELALPLKIRLRSIERRLQKIEADGMRLEEYLARREEGELLKPNLQRIRKGMTSIEVQDWSTGKTRIIPLDPARDGVANMERLFQLSAKARRGRIKVEERRKTTLAEKKAIEDLLYFVEQAATLEELEQVAPVSLEEGKGKAKDCKGARDPSENESPFFRYFKTSEGRSVLVGKSGKGNAFLLRHKAKKGDMWFHVQDYPGAHVVLLVRDRTEVSENDVFTAGKLAVRYSRARDKGKVNVMVADVGDVQQISGGIPGQVIVKSFRTILCESD